MKETEQLKKEKQELQNELYNKNTHSLTSNQLILKRLTIIDSFDSIDHSRI